MGRGRAKAKKLSVTNQDDPGSGEEEKVPAQKRRGRPLKLLKDEINDDDAQKLEDEDTNGVSDKDTKSKNVSPAKKQKMNAQIEEKANPVKEETGNGTGSSIEELNKSNGFRHIGSRRKNKPRRAAESTVECN